MLFKFLASDLVRHFNYFFLFLKCSCFSYCCFGHIKLFCCLSKCLRFGCKVKIWVFCLLFVVCSLIFICLTDNLECGATLCNFSGDRSRSRNVKFNDVCVLSTETSCSIACTSPSPHEDKERLQTDYKMHVQVLHMELNMVDKVCIQGQQHNHKDTFP